ncbi:hypothetical protein KIPB_005595 [Kipferlia bialata]|uniref:Metallo-beta-lactamase domain-containing protein n=1 Tax=Kipferlia bialata TaxID=797122 RepID=A0A9K3CVV6_9EUKA|nr:hypothetical protein KIPB_005595 [Kipferlia bialata]|eukprot:g5595.t1
MVLPSGVYHAEDPAFSSHEHESGEVSHTHSILDPAAVEDGNSGRREYGSGLAVDYGVNGDSYWGVPEAWDASDDSEASESPFVSQSFHSYDTSLCETLERDAVDTGSGELFLTAGLSGSQPLQQGDTKRSSSSTSTWITDQSRETVVGTLRVNEQEPGPSDKTGLQGSGQPPQTLSPTEQVTLSYITLPTEKIYAFFLIRIGDYCAVVDAGRALTESSKYFQSDVARLLTKTKTLLKGAKAIDCFITHNHEDHNGYQGMFEQYLDNKDNCHVIVRKKKKVDLVDKGFIRVYPGGAGQDNKDVQNVYEKRTRSYKVRLYVPPPVADKGDKNGESFAVEVSFLQTPKKSETRVLFTGDMEWDKMAPFFDDQKPTAMVSRNVDIMTIPHHGSVPNSPVELYTHTCPRVVLLPGGKHNDTDFLGYWEAVRANIFDGLRPNTGRPSLLALRFNCSTITAKSVWCERVASDAAEDYCRKARRGLREWVCESLELVDPTDEHLARCKGVLLGLVAVEAKEEKRLKSLRAVSSYSKLRDVVGATLVSALYNRNGDVTLTQGAPKRHSAGHQNQTLLNMLSPKEQRKSAMTKVARWSDEGTKATVPLFLEIVARHAGLDFQSGSQKPSPFAEWWVAEREAVVQGEHPVDLVEHRYLTTQSLSAFEVGIQEGEVVSIIRRYPPPKRIRL